MGWLFMSSLKGHSGPTAYLDAKFTFERPEQRARVLRSALVGMRTYYAAVEIVASGKSREVIAIVCLVQYTPRDSKGDVFGYRDMSEHMGPSDCNCPEPVLDLLTPTQDANALDWRSRCRANVALRRERSAKPKPRPGQVIVFDQAIRFRDGRVLDRFEVMPDNRAGRTMLYRDPETGRLYRVPNVKTRTYTLISPGTSRAAMSLQSLPIVGGL